MTPSTGSSAFPTYVALVPLEADAPDLMSELIKVAAALQIQVTRDFHPVWGVSAAVVPFATIDQVPASYIPLTVTTKQLPLDRKGFHFSLQGLPFAVVEHEPDLQWSLYASHELLEMLRDPHGQEMVLAQSLEVAAQDPPSAKTDSELFNYILEVCDPCEYSTYKINGVDVSDFVTPRYYSVGERAVGERAVGPYSFLNRVQKPLDVLTGGYISWRKYPPTGLIYQAYSEIDNEDQFRRDVCAGTRVAESVPASELKCKVVGGSSRFPVAAQRSRPSDAADRRTDPKPPSFPRHADLSPQATLRADIESLLAWVTFQATAKRPDLSALLKHLEELVNNSGAWETFNKESDTRRTTLDGLGIPLEHRDPSSRISIDTLREISEFLKTQEDAADAFGSGDSLFGLWLAVQIG